MAKKWQEIRYDAMNRPRSRPVKAERVSAAAVAEPSDAELERLTAPPPVQPRSGKR